MYLLLCLTALTLPCFTAAAAFMNEEPVIGILAQDIVTGAKPNESSYLSAGYVKTMESAGARVVPILINLTETEYKTLFNRINGILFPGGAANLLTSGYARAAKIFYNLAIEAYKKGDYFPVWGTCLGFEQLAVLTSDTNDRSVLVRTNTTALSLPLNFTQEANRSRMFKDFSDEIMNALATEPLTINVHKWSVSMETYNANENLKKFYRVLSTNHDASLEFISTFEARDYPIYGVQWHPEKSAYEWTRDFYSHSPNAVRVSFYFAEFFVNEARKSKHTFESDQATRERLIYHYNPTYTGEISTFEQKYFFGTPNQAPAPAAHNLVFAAVLACVILSGA